MPDLSVLIVGTGFAGLGMAIRLKRAGIEDFVLLERAADIGGTWRDNRYPGCACDVQSNLYCFSFEQNPNWTRKYPPRAEIQAYLQHCADKYALRPHIRLSEEVERADYDERRALWRVSTTSGGRYDARVLIPAVGGLSEPSLPNLPGIERFAGPSFHSARWNHGCDLTGKRVAVVGTGASAIQFVPAIVDRVARIDLYQRTAAWVLPKPDRPVRRVERNLYRALPVLQRLVRLRTYLVAERIVLGFVLDPRLLSLPQRAAYAHLKDQVPDPELRRKLKPSYTIGCKRVLLSNDWYPAITREHVEIVTEPIAQVTATGVRTADGTERLADVIIYGTGFCPQAPAASGAIYGRGGRSLRDVWNLRPSAYKGSTISGFPNLFLLGGPNTGIGHTSMVYMLESQIAYVVDAIETMRAQRWRSVEVKAECQALFVDSIDERSDRTVWRSGCRSWYLDEHGRNTALWPGFSFRFRALTRRFDASAYRVST